MFCNNCWKIYESYDENVCYYCRFFKFNLSSRYLSNKKNCPHSYCYCLHCRYYSSSTLAHYCYSYWKYSLHPSDKCSILPMMERNEVCFCYKKIFKSIKSSSKRRRRRRFVFLLVERRFFSGSITKCRNGVDFNNTFFWMTLSFMGFTVPIVRCFLHRLLIESELILLLLLFRIYVI